VTAAHGNSGNLVTVTAYSDSHSSAVDSDCDFSRIGSRSLHRGRVTAGSKGGQTHLETSRGRGQLQAARLQHSL